MALPELSKEQLEYGASHLGFVMGWLEQEQAQRRAPTTIEYRAMLREGIRRVLEAMFEEYPANPKPLPANLVAAIDAADHRLFPKRHQEPPAEANPNPHQ